MDIINVRFKEIRNALNKSQKDIGDKLGLSNSGISNIENGVRSVTDKHIKLLVAAFNVNENWLRTGHGEMFVESSDTVIDQLVSEYKLDSLDKQLLTTYLELSPVNRQKLKTFLTSFSAKAAMANVIQDPIDQKLAEYRQELEAEQRAPLVCEDSDEKKNSTK